MNLVARIVPVAALLALSAIGCGGGDSNPDDTLASDDSSDELAAGDPTRINIGFNGASPGQFEYSDAFFAATAAQPGPRLCHTYTAWNVADQPAVAGDANQPLAKRARFQAWVDGANGHCDEMLVSFQAYQNGNAPHPGDFARAFRKFLSTNWGFHGTFSFTPWNEPNNPGGGGDGLGHTIDPETGARYFLSMTKACEPVGCKVAAGDMATNGNWWNDFEWNCANDNVATQDLCKQKSRFSHGRGPSYLDRYKDFIVQLAPSYGFTTDFRPKYFAFHGWHDLNMYMHSNDHCTSYDDCVTRRLLTSLGGSWGGVEIWDTEVGIDQDGPSVPDSVQACGAAFLLRMTAMSRRITRIYYTRLHGGSGELLHGHTPRPAMTILAERDVNYGKGKCW